MVGTTPVKVRLCFCAFFLIVDCFVVSFFGESGPRSILSNCVFSPTFMLARRDYTLAELILIIRSAKLSPIVDMTILEEAGVPRPALSTL